MTDRGDPWEGDYTPRHGLGGAIPDEDGRKDKEQRPDPTPPEEPAEVAEETTEPAPTTEAAEAEPVEEEPAEPTTEAAEAEPTTEEAEAESLEAEPVAKEPPEPEPATEEEPPQPDPPEPTTEDAEAEPIAAEPAEEEPAAAEPTTEVAEAKPLAAEPAEEQPAAPEPTTEEPVVESLEAEPVEEEPAAAEPTTEEAVVESLEAEPVEEEPAEQEPVAPESRPHTEEPEPEPVEEEPAEPVPAPPGSQDRDEIEPVYEEPAQPETLSAERDAGAVVEEAAEPVMEESLQAGPLEGERDEPAVPAHGPGPPAGPPRLFSGPNLPFLWAIALSIVAVALYLSLAGTEKFFGRDDGGGTATTAPATTLQPDGSDTTAPGTTPAQTTQVTAPPDAATPLQGLDAEIVSDDLSFPVFATSPPGDDRLFVVERPGTVVIIDPDRGLLPQPFLDISDRVDDATGIELGLLGLAFHPDYAENGRFFAYYTDNSQDPRLVELSVSTDPDVADPDETLLITYAKDTLRHNAGMLAFDPDGYLWAALGDGATGGEPAQDTDDIRGSLLRIDVDSGKPYAIPPGNPFPGGGAPEVYAYGLRNPWRFSIDAAERLVYIGDVGQARYEEIDVMSLDDAGIDFGWPDTEGEACYIPETGCDTSGVTFPVLVNGREGGSCSITGGYVYRGSAIPELFGHYFYADWCAGWIRSFRYDQGSATDQQDWSTDIGNLGSITSFGVDSEGEPYVTTSEGTLAKIVPVR